MLYFVAKIYPMKYLLSLLLLVPVCHAHAQKLPLSKAVKYNTRTPIDSEQMKDYGGTNYLYEDISAKTLFTAGIGMGAIVSSGDIFQMNLGAQADLYLKQRLSFHAGYSRAFADVENMYAHGAGDNTNLSENETKGAYDADLGVRFYINKKAVRKKHMVILESKRVSSRTTVNYYIKPTLPAQHIYAVRAGYFSYRAVVNTDMNSAELKYDDKGAVISQDGTVLSSRYYTNSFTTGAYVGFSSILLFNNITKNNFKSSFFQTRYVRELYADILFANTTFDPIISNGVSHEIIANKTGSFQTSRVGMRIGTSSTTRYKRMATSQKLELGYRPGVSGSGWFGTFGVSFGMLK
jgi:hypothetical protein